VSQLAIFLFGTGVFFLGGVGLVLVGLDAFRSWSEEDEASGEPAFRAAEQARADVRAEDAHGQDAHDRDAR
jgi:hypothetical protein